MSSLSNFRKDATASTPVRRTGPKGPPDRNRCPAGWDEDIWRLALMFERYAWADKISLKAGRPVIYAELASLVNDFEMRGRSTIGSYRQEVYRCDERFHGADMASRCWRHFPPNDPGNQVAGDLTWYEMFEVIMASFWSRIQNEYALDAFRQHFREHGAAAVNHWKSLRILKGIDERYKDAPRPPMTRRAKPGGSMPSATKEG